MPQINNAQRAFPGAYRKDYRFVSYGGAVYVVYIVKVRGISIEVSWKLSEKELKALGVDRNRVQHVSKSHFQKINFLGSWDQVSSSALPEEHPFTTFVKNLRRQHGNVSWLHNDHFVAVLLEGWAEGWSEGEIQNVLEQTKWYKSRNEAQRAWEMDTNPAERKTRVNNRIQLIKDALEEMYGIGFNLSKAGITQKDIKKWAEQIESGKWGAAEEGFQFWFSQQQDKAADQEGTPAWISEQEQLEEQRAFMNRPEDVFQSIKQDALVWLGPSGLPSDDTLREWAQKLVSEKKSDADWQQFLQKRSQKLYPFLDGNTPWQEFVDPYRAILEKTWGTNINWDSPLLQSLGATDANGKPTGQPLGFFEFEKLARQDPRFWGSEAARTEGFGLLGTLLEKFQGVSA